MARQPDRESPWKELLEHDFQLFFQFFFPKIALDLDWSRDVESLNQEFRSQVPVPKGRRIADTLIRMFRLLNGDVRYFHFEIQARRGKLFPRRVYVYNRRAENRYDEPVTSLVLYIDRSPDWRPRSYRSRRYGLGTGLKFGTRKLLTYRGREEQLFADTNPVALFVLAALEAWRTEKDEPERERVKLRLIRRLPEYKMDSESLRHWFRYLDWLLPLSSEGEARVLNQVRQMEEETKVPFITYAERMGIEKGIEQGIEKGIEQGIEKGIEQGIEKGRQSTLDALTILLKIKYGQPGIDFAGELQTASLERLQAILAQVEASATVEDLRQRTTVS